MSKKASDIMYRKWGSSPSRAVLLLVHGMGASTERWKFLGDFFSEQGIASYAIVLRGFGATPGVRGHVDSFNTYYQDICALRDVIISENPRAKVFILGESMGALIAFKITDLYPDMFDGLICSSPAFSSRLKFSVLKYLRIAMSFFFHPDKQFRVPFNSAMCTRDTTYIKEMDSSSQEHRLASGQLLSEILFLQIGALLFRNRFRKDVLFLLSGSDEVVDPACSRKIYAKLDVPSKTIREYPDMKHAISVDLGKEKVFADIWEWLRPRIGGEGA